jgi:hypothetical protein
MSHETSDNRNRLLRWIIWTAGAVALAYLIVEHRPHLLGWIPYLIILACPLMHLFMHRSHGGHGGHHESQDPATRKR